MVKRRVFLNKTYDSRYKELENPCCVYCGDKQEVLDHVPPISFLESYGETLLITEYNAPFVKVPCCYECNAFLGDSPLFNIKERKEYIHKKLLFTYKKILEAPEWTLEEIEELSGRLKESILNQQQFKSFLKKRLIYSS